MRVYAYACVSFSLPTFSSGFRFHTLLLVCVLFPLIFKGLVFTNKRPTRKQTNKQMKKKPATKLKSFTAIQFSQPMAYEKKL